MHDSCVMPVVFVYEADARVRPAALLSLKIRAKFVRMWGLCRTSYKNILTCSIRVGPIWRLGHLV